MLRSTTSRCCTRSCRALQSAPSLIARGESTSASSPSEASKLKNSKSGEKTTAEELRSQQKQSTHDATSRLQQGGRLQRSRNLALLRATSVYHQAIDFPYFGEDAEQLKSIAKNGTPVPVAVNDYVNSKIAHALTPLTVDRPRPRPPKLATQHDQHAYMAENMKRNEFRLGVEDVTSKAEKPWDAFAPDAPRESRIRARRMVDALLGTVDARNPGPQLVRDVCEANERLSAARKARNEEN